VEGVEDLNVCECTFLSATTCLSLRSTAFQTMPYAPLPSF